MISLPKIHLTDDGKSCKCFPFCKNRRREWKGQLLKTSAELLLERRPIPECHRRYPHRVYPNSPCPLFARKSHIFTQPIGLQKPQKVVRICQAPIFSTVDRTYLDYIELAKKLGAWQLVSRKNCPLCTCGKCCTCNKNLNYQMRDAERSIMRRSDMKHFDAKVIRDREKDSMRIMYDGNILYLSDRNVDHTRCSEVTIATEV